MRQFDAWYAEHRVKALGLAHHPAIVSITPPVVLRPTAPEAPPQTAADYSREPVRLITQVRMETKPPVVLLPSGPTNRLVASWQNLRPNTQKRCVAWIDHDMPDHFPLLEEHLFRDSSAAFRSLAKECGDEEIDEFVALAKAAVS